MDRSVRWHELGRRWRGGCVGGCATGGDHAGAIAWYRSQYNAYQNNV